MKRLIFVTVSVVAVIATLSIAYRFVYPQQTSDLKIVMAEDILNEIDVDPGGYYPTFGSVELPAAEMEKLVNELRSRHPFVSVASRLEREVTDQGDVQSSTVLSADAQHLLERTEREFGSGYKQRRVRSLERLHGDEVESFINREGFGFFRRPPLSPSPKALKFEQIATYRLNPIEPTSEYVEGALVELESGTGISENGLPGSRAIHRFHLESLKKFATPDSIGFVKDSENVSGFESHRLELSTRWNGSAVANNTAGHDWKVNRLELVSLLLNDDPVVYVSDQLPTMENVDDRQTRPLNDFEESSLGKLLESGEGIVSSANLNRIEMLGAIRATESCLNCHDGERGKLLGAFSYEILRDPPVNIPRHEKQKDLISL